MNTAEIRARLTAAGHSLGLDGTEEGERGVDLITDFINQMQIYEGAMYEISTKLEILDSEFQVQFSHNPIHHLERRLKSTNLFWANSTDVAFPIRWRRFVTTCSTSLAYA